MTGILNRLLEKMLGEKGKEIPSIDVEGNSFLGRQRRQTVPMVTFVDVIEPIGHP
jgi:hypothetical protein